MLETITAKQEDASGKAVEIGTVNVLLILLLLLVAISVGEELPVESFFQVKF